VSTITRPDPGGKEEKAVPTNDPTPSTLGGDFRHNHEWRDWRLEWQLEVGTLCLRILACRDRDIVVRLRRLAEERPANEADWMALGGRIRAVEQELAGHAGQL
jgi:hypothetical protein